MVAEDPSRLVIYLLPSRTGEPGKTKPIGLPCTKRAWQARFCPQLRYSPPGAPTFSTAGIESEAFPFRLRLNAGKVVLISSL